MGSCRYMWYMLLLVSADFPQKSIGIKVVQAAQACEGESDAHVDMSDLPAVPCCAVLQDPNPEDPLNKEAAQKFQESQRNFETLVQRSIHYGAQIGSMFFPPCAS